MFLWPNNHAVKRFRPGEVVPYAAVGLHDSYNLAVLTSESQSFDASQMSCFGCAKNCSYL
jgi:hypothetical protein